MMATENLFGYTLVDTAYTAGAVGAIRGERDDVPANFSVATNRVTGLNSDPTVHYFTASNGKPHAVVAQYDFSSPSAINMNIYDISNAIWSSPTTVNWSDIYNLYGITVIGNFMYAIDYDNAKVVRILMTNYQQVPFPGNVYQFDNTPGGL